MASLDLGTLQVGVKVTGADKAEQDLNQVKKAVKDVDDTSSKSAKGVNGLLGAFKKGVNDSTLFGNKLGDLGGALGSAQGMSALLQGAVTGLTMAFVDMAVRAIQQAIAGLIEFGKKGVELASDLREVKNVVDTTFGGSAEVIDTWASGTAGAFGLADLQAKEFVGTMGSIIKASGLTEEATVTMSQGLSQLAGDLASFRNLEIDEAFEKLRAGIVGETEPLRSLGIVMTEANLQAYMLAQGVEKSWREMSEAEKVAIRYNYILSRTKDAQGDFNKTADEYANVSRTMDNAIDTTAAKFGEGLIPALTEAKGSFTTFLTDNQETITLLGNLVGGVISLLVNTVKSLLRPLEPTLKLLNMVSGVVNNIIDGVRNSLDQFLGSFRSSSEKTTNDVKYDMVNVADATKDAFGQATEDVSDSITKMGNETSSALDALKATLDKFYDNEAKEYQKQLEKRFGNSKSGLIKQSEYMEQFQKKQQEQRLKDEEDYTKKIEIESKKRQQIQEEWLKKQKEGMSLSGVSNNQRYANGTLSAPGGWSLVGETGPELMYIPPKTQVVNNNTTEQILGSGNGPTYHINTVTVQSNTPKEFFRELEEISRRK